MIFKKTLTTLLACAIIGTAPLLPGKLGGEVRADVIDSEVVYRRKAWEVSLVAFDDGTFACTARVGGGDSSFSIWATANDNASLQFYNSGWQFDGSSADIVVRVDRRAKWTLNDSNLSQNSVFFTLPDEDASLRFLREIMRGNILNLYSSSGSLIERYSLAGSSASILKLSECVDVLKGAGSGGNPFN
ncbi:MAG: hypothetical protein KDK00_13885 [Rhodobacteraceae bacterium]|nr:hypothetical protein [Paracoccaceae bacterium]